ncbi:MAG: zinc ABC transporter substrate-binding protein [Thiotrichales bacterium]|nr:zinc ABC transporter substrate-binding protein [Thiotrichales bacterium]
MITRRALLKSTAVAAAVAATAAVLAPASAESDAPIRVVATFSILGDMVSRIGGEHVAVTTLVGPDGDAHVYRPTPTAARAVSEADVLVVNGLDFEGWLDRLIESADFGGVHVVATAGIEPITFEDDHGDGHGDGHEGGHDDHEEHGDEHDEHAEHTGHDGHDEHDEHAEHDAHEGHDEHDGHHGHHHGAFDPHAWQSLRNAVTYVDNVTAALAKIDPDHASVFYRNRAAYVAEIEALDAEIGGLLAELPEGARTIVTSHDAFQYFGRDYGLAFIAPQGISTESEASAKDVVRLIELIRSEGIRAVFLENIADPRLLKRIADETGATVGGTLYPGALSGPEGPAPTYLDMMRHNARTLAQALAP